MIVRSMLQPQLAPKPTKGRDRRYLHAADRLAAADLVLPAGIPDPGRARCHPVRAGHAVGGGRRRRLGGLLLTFAYRAFTWQRLRESVYLTVRTTAMVCWLFVGSWTFSSVFSYLGGEQIISEFVTGLEISPIMFLIMAQIIIFILGWPLEWSEIIIIFVPIFPAAAAALRHRPLFFGILVALNLQTSFLTPPMAMSAYHLKGIAPPHVQLNQIFKGNYPFLAMVVFSMIILYQFPQIAFWLPDQVYGR